MSPATALRFALFALLTAAPASGHPMGNFSVSHYARLEAQPSGVMVRYVLDLAELPAFELLRKWQLTPDSPKAAMDAKAAAEAGEWVRNLRFTLDGQTVAAQLLDAQFAITNGAGNLPAARVTLHLSVPADHGGTLEYEDTNYAGREGWKEIVIIAGKGAALVTASHADLERSQALTVYPASAVPPRDLRAHLQWKAAGTAQTAVVPIEQPAAVGVAPAEAKSPVKGDALSNLLSKQDLTLGTTLIGLAMAFWFGCLHATTPGHGKTMVAAYLVGERGTAKHAVLLGAIVTVTHTMSVFAMGIAAYFLAGSFAADKVTHLLQVVSGLMIVAVGLWLLYKRSMKLMNDGHHPHHHDHHHHHHPGHDHDHHHDGHTHVPEGPVTMGSLLALGASGGLVPCPSALILLLTAVSLGRIGFGLALLVAFSLGLAGVLMAIGLAVLYAKQLLPQTARTLNHPAVKLIPVFSAVVVTIIGIAMTAYALGWIRLGA